MRVRTFFFLSLLVVTAVLVAAGLRPEMFSFLQAHVQAPFKNRLHGSILYPGPANPLLVVSVNPDWGFVVLDTRLNDNIKKDTRLHVIRDGSIVAMMNVESAENGRAMATIKTESLVSGSRVIPGDSAILETPDLTASGSLSLEYPAEMMENETRSVELKYEVRDVSKTHLPPREKLPPADDLPIIAPLIKDSDRNLDFELSSSGFEIGGKKHVLEKAPVPLPMKHVWTITPKNEGSHELLLQFKAVHRGPELTDSNPKAEIAPEMIKVAVNGMELTTDTDGWYRLPVKVKTYLGITKKTQYAITATSGILAFVLGWPIFIGFLKRRLGWGGEEGAPGAPRNRRTRR